MREGYKRTELGEIPEDWDVVNISSVAERCSGHTPNKKEKSYWNGNIPWISLKDTKRLDNGYVDKTTDYTSIQGIQNSSAVLLPKGTVVVSRDATIGKVGITKMEMATSQHFINYICSNKLFEWFLYYYFYYNKPMFERIAIGSTIKTIGLGFFNSLKIILPQINEQKKIASILSSVDEHIEEIAFMIEDLKELKKGLMKKLLTGQYTIEDGKLVKTKEFKKTSLGMLPMSWEVKRLDKISTLITKGTTPTTLGFDFVKKGINFIKIENIGSNGKFNNKSLKNINEECHDKLKRSKLEENDILVSIAGSLGKSIIINKDLLPANTNQALAIVRTNNSYCFEYINRIFDTEYFRKYISRVSTVGAQPNLSLRQLGEYTFPFPTLNEQEKIVNILNALDNRIETYKDEKQDFHNLKKGLMQQLLTGKIRVKVD